MKEIWRVYQKSDCYDKTIKRATLQTVIETKLNVQCDPEKRINVKKYWSIFLNVQFKDNNDHDIDYCKTSEINHLELEAEAFSTDNGLHKDIRHVKAQKKELLGKECVVCGGTENKWEHYQLPYLHYGWGHPITPSK